MTDFNNIRLTENTKNAEKFLDASDKGGQIFQRAVFELVALILIVALFMFENGELIIKEQSIVVLMGNIAVMFILSILFDNNYRIKGKLVGFSTKRYQAAVKRLTDVTINLNDNDIKTLNEQIEKYVDEKESKDISQALYKVAVTKSDYDEKYKFLGSSELKKAGLKRQQIRGIKKAKLVRRINLSPDSLMNEVNFSKTNFDLGKSSKRLDVEHNVKSVTMYLFTAIVFAYFAVGLSKDLTIASVGWYLMKVCFLSFRGVKSYFESYLEVAERSTTRLVSQASYIEYFIGSKTIEENKEK
ncbi:MAG: hypothetical protein RR107_01340 [Clostridia bacterium]